MLISFLMAVLLHEGGHILAILLLRGKLCGFAVSPFGFTLKAHLPASYTVKTAVALAGPVVGLLAYFFTRRAASALLLFGDVSLLLSLFNLIPALPLDGGKALLFLLSAFLPERRALTLTRAVTLSFALLLWTLSGYLMLFMNASPSLFFLSLWLLASLLYPSQQAQPFLKKQPLDKKAVI